MEQYESSYLLHESSTNIIVRQFIYPFITINACVFVFVYLWNSTSASTAQWP